MSLSSVREKTFSARKLHGWSAVAQELEPYLNSTRWASGAPLPPSLIEDAREQPRPPPWPSGVTNTLFGSLQMKASAVYVGVLLCMCIYAWAKPLRDSCSDVPLGLRVGAYAGALAGPLVLVTVVHVLALCTMDEVPSSLERHIRVLYMLLYLDKADEGKRAEMLKNVSEKNSASDGVSLAKVGMPDLLNVV